jgi:hypothetical protein
MYRDEHEADRHRAARVRERIDARAALMTPALRNHLPRPLLARLHAALAAAAGEGATLAQLEDCDALLDEVLALVPELEADLNALPADIQPDAAAPLWDRLWLAAPPLWPAVETNLAQFVHRLDPNGTSWRPREKQALDARFVVDGATLDDDAHRAARKGPRTPIALRVQADRNDVGEVELALATPVPAGMPYVAIRPREFVDAFTRVLRVHREVAIGDDEIDGRFVIEGPEELVRRALDAGTRSALLRIARFDVPSIEVQHGVARIRWFWDATFFPLAAAARILHHLRHLEANVHVLGG